MRESKCYTAIAKIAISAVNTVNTVAFALNYYSRHEFAGVLNVCCRSDRPMCCFRATVCKTVRPMLSDRCLSVLSVCNVRALWPNGWTDQYQTWQAGRPRPWPHCVRWEPSSPSPKGHSPSQFSAHICCGQMAAWIKMPLGMQVGLSSAPSPNRGRSPFPNFRPISIVDKQLDASRCHLVRR